MKIRTVWLILIVLVVAGCTNTNQITPVVPQMEIVEEVQGWVEVRVTGIEQLGYQIHWGDVDTSYGVSDIIPEQETYYHFYQAVEGTSSGEQIPTEYYITLINPQEYTVAQESILIIFVDCHLALVEIDGREVTVRYWGRFGIAYSISWGDGEAHHLQIDMELGTGLLTHEYSEAGTYTLGMEEIYAPRQEFFRVTIE
jgi:hypothetical protein